MTHKRRAMLIPRGVGCTLTLTKHTRVYLWCLCSLLNPASVQLPPLHLHLAFTSNSLDGICVAVFGLLLISGLWIEISGTRLRTWYMLRRSCQTHTSVLCGLWCFWNFAWNLLKRYAHSSWTILGTPVAFFSRSDLELVNARFEFGSIMSRRFQVYQSVN